MKAGRLHQQASSLRSPEAERAGHLDYELDTGYKKAKVESEAELQKLI